MQTTLFLLAFAMAFPAGAAAVHLLAIPQRRSPPRGRSGARREG
jgi:hypothetical protein